jgi:bacillithiol biosynthesis cysteine-adding enzyme BshC
MARPSFVLEYGAFGQALSPLFRDYLAAAPRALAFFGGSAWHSEALAEGSARAQKMTRPAAALAAALVRQQEERGASAAAARAPEVGRPGAVAVLTGQQPVLFGGPLYVLYKALAARKAARLLQERRGLPAVAVFWVASDDHDFAEVRSTTVIDESGQIRTLRYSPRHEPVAQPASRIFLEEGIAALVEELACSLPEGLHRDEVIQRLRDSYRPGATLSGAFARLLSSLIPGLVVLDPADPAIKSLMVPLFRREIEEGSPTSRLAREAGAALLAAGYHQQVPVRPGFLNLFVVMDGQRRALAIQDGTVEVRGPGRKLLVEEAVRLLEAQPEDWSPGVLLRPLAQDLIFPTAAYVAGPAEIAYHAQIAPSYAHFGLPRPVLLPRPSLTLVEPPQGRALDAEGLKLTDLEADPEAIVARWAREAYPDVEAAFARTRESVVREMGNVEEALGSLDPTLRAAAAAARGRALHQIATLHEKAIRALKKKERSRAERLRRTRDALFPGGAFQERGLGLMSALARHGAALVDEIEERMDLWAKGHQVLYL